MLSKNAGAIEEWHTSGKKNGWTFRIKDKRRAIIYFIPTEKSFKLGLVFGGKATDRALASEKNDEIKEIIRTAPVYAERRGFRIDLNEIKDMADIKVLVQSKMET